MGLARCDVGDEPSISGILHYHLASPPLETPARATRQQCDDFAQAHADGQANPVQIQGTFSYTVTGDQQSFPVLRA